MKLTAHFHLMPLLCTSAATPPLSIYFKDMQKGNVDSTSAILSLLSSLKKKICRVTRSLCCVSDFNFWFQMGCTLSRGLCFWNVSGRQKEDISIVTPRSKNYQFRKLRVTSSFVWLCKSEHFMHQKAIFTLFKYVRFSFLSIPALLVDYNL